jgi:hypothetical protein
MNRSLKIFAAYFSVTTLLAGCAKNAAEKVDTNWLIDFSTELRNFSLFWLLPAGALFMLTATDWPETEHTGYTSEMHAVYTKTGRTISGDPEKAKKQAIWWLNNFPFIGIYLFYYYRVFSLITGYPNLDALLSLIISWLIVPACIIAASMGLQKAFTYVFGAPVVASVSRALWIAASVNLLVWTIYLVSPLVLRLCGAIANSILNSILWLFAR